MTKYQSVRPTISFCPCRHRVPSNAPKVQRVKSTTMLHKNKQPFVHHGASYMRATSTVNTLSFWTVHPTKQCKLRSACSLGIGVIRVYTVAISSVHCRSYRNNRPIIVGQGPTVFAAGTDCNCLIFGVFFFNFNGVLPGN